MSEPTSAYTFRDLVSKIAHEMCVAYYASGTGKALIPADDEYNLQLCKEIVNDGIKMFIAWRWMRRLMQVNISNLRITGTADAADSTH